MRSKISAEDAPKCELVHTWGIKPGQFYARCEGRLTMDDPRRRLDRAVWFFVLSAAACLASGTASAQTTNYLMVQLFDVCTGTSPTATGCAPYNMTSTVGNVSCTGGTGGVASTTLTITSCSSGTLHTADTLSGAGIASNTIITAGPSAGGAGTYTLNQQANVPTGTTITAMGPVGFWANPTTGTAYPATGGVDVTQAMLQQIGVNLVYINGAGTTTTIPTQIAGNTTLGVTQNTNTVATCTGSITGLVLTIPSACSGTPGIVSVNDSLSGTGIAANTIVTRLGPGTNGGAGTYAVNISQTVTSTTITVQTTTYTSQDLLNLEQANETLYPVMTGTIRLYNVTKLNPPSQQAGSQLYDLSIIGPISFDDGGEYGLVSIAGNAFYPPQFVPVQTDIFFHAFGHSAFSWDHDIFGAGQYNAFNETTNPNGGVWLSTPSTQLPTNPLPLECDPSYSACKADAMSPGSLSRTEASLQCVLASFSGEGTPTPAACFTAKTVGGVTTYTQQAGLYSQNAPAAQVSTCADDGNANLQTSQERQAQASSLLGHPSPPASCVDPPPSLKSGLLHPIPHETTKAQAGTGGSSADAVTFDVSGPTRGRPGETLLAWVLVLPQEQTFAGPSRFRIVAQSREDLVEGVHYYPGGEHDPPARNIAYRADGGNNPDSASAGRAIETAAYSACAAAAAECLMVKFEPPGLGASDSISFSKNILSGGAAITNDNLCKAKITYVFSDGYVTTSNFGPCPAKSLPLTASSWRPDPTVSPQIVKTSIVLAQASPPSLSSSSLTFADANPATQFQPSQSCPYTGPPINQNVNVATGQNCVFTCPSPSSINGNVTITGGSVTSSCEINGNVTISDGGSFWSDSVNEGNVTDNSGTLVLASGASVSGNVNINQAISFAIGSDVRIQGNLGITQLPANLPPASSVCGTTVIGHLTAQNNAGPLQIGGATSSCPNNTYSQLTCQNNTDPIMPNQCSQ